MSKDEGSSSRARFVFQNPTHKLIVRKVRFALLQCVVRQRRAAGATRARRI
jgi:hypothetical protein